MFDVLGWPSNSTKCCCLKSICMHLTHYNELYCIALHWNGTILHKSVYQWWARLGLTIKIEIETFENLVFILRLVLRLSILQSLCWDWYRDFRDCSLDIKTSIETFKVVVLISRLVSRLSGSQSWYQDPYRDLQNCSSDIKTGIERFTNL